MRKAVLPVLLVASSLAACGTSPRERVVTGSLAGAGTGVVVGAVTTGTVGGALLMGTLGAVGGGIIGYGTAPHECFTTDRHGYRYRVRC